MTPKPKGLLQWLAGTVADAFDAAKESRIEGHAAEVDSMMGRLRLQFDFSKAAADLQISEKDRPLVAERVYRRFLGRIWRDAEVSSKETKILEWVAKKLAIPSAVVSGLNSDAAGEVFKGALAKAIGDGRIDDEETAKLQAIASHAGQSVGEMMTRFFQKEGDALLRNIFSKAAADGELDRKEWEEFRLTAERLGIPRDQMLRAIRQPAKQLVEHVLADARSDGVISDEEEQLLENLLDLIIDGPMFSRYVRTQIVDAKDMQRLQKGLLPTLPAPTGVALRAGEIVHWVGPVRYVQVRKLASGPKTLEVNGDAVITDARMILNALDKSFEVSHRKVLAHFPMGEEIEIRAANKGAGRYTFCDGGKKAVVIWQIAVGRANQTIVAAEDSQTRRYIPRDVRQRVWQRYGGRCAECSATTYLEFDHIIPVAKGGGNSETNVQLLCRRCNLAKSANI